MTTAYTSFYDYVIPDVPGAQTPVVLQAIREACIELFERSLIYRQELQEILVLGTTATTTTVAATEGDTAVVVDSITGFSANDTITVGLSNNTRWRGHVSGSPAGSTITLDGQLNEDVDIGAAVTKLVYLYPITLPTGYAMVKGLEAWLNDKPIDPISPDDLDAELSTWLRNWRTDCGEPTRWYMPDDATVGLLFSSSAEGNLRINAALKPTHASTGIPDIIFERYVQTIAHGAKARLMLSPEKPYTNLKLGAFHEDQFNGAIGEAKIRAARGNTRASLRTRTVFGLR